MTDTRSAALRRPPWMTAFALFCAATVAFLAARDLFYAPAREVEVWFGFELRGRWALVTAPLHWLVFGVGAWGFWRQRSWILPCATGYAFAIALSHLVWSGVSANGAGWGMGVGYALVFSIPGFVLIYLQRLRVSSGSARSD